MAACPGCQRAFNHADKLPLLARCGHTICASCMLEATRCCRCGRHIPEDSERPLNFALAELLGLLGPPAALARPCGDGQRSAAREQQRDECLGDAEGLKEGDLDEDEEGEEEEQEGEEEEGQEQEQGEEETQQEQPHGRPLEILVDVFVVDPQRMERCDRVTQLRLALQPRPNYPRESARLPLVELRRRLQGRGVPDAAWRFAFRKPHKWEPGTSYTRLHMLYEHVRMDGAVEVWAVGGPSTA